MTKEEKYSLAKWAMEEALSLGADQVSVSISESKSSSVDVREQKIDTLKEAIQSSMTIKLYIDKKYSSHKTNRLNKKDLSHLIEQAIAGTKYLTADAVRTLPNPSRYYKGDGSDLKTTDPLYDQIEPETKIDLAYQIEAEAWQKDDRIISITTSYSDYTGSRVLVTSNGFEGDSESSNFSLSASVSVDGGEARPSESWSERAIIFEKLKSTEIGSTALNRAIKRIGQAKIKSGKFDMIVENKAVSRLLSPLMNALDGSNIQQKSSFLIDKIGEQVASEKLTLTDDPFIIGGIGSKHFDDEGLATKKRVVFNKGKLQTYFIDTYYAKKLETEPTSGDTSNLIFETGDKSQDELITHMKNGILVTGFNGGNTNSSTGDFSYGIDGFLIQNGEIAQPISEMNISGNMKELWTKLAEVGNDPYLKSSWQTPSLLFSSIDFSGL